MPQTQARKAIVPMVDQVDRLDEVDRADAAASIRCPVCGGTANELKYGACRDLLYPTPGEFSLRFCRECGAYFCHPQITPDQFDTYYLASYYPSAEQIVQRQDPARLRNRVKFGLMRRFWGRGADTAASHAFREIASIMSGTLRITPKLSGNGRLLEVGCSSGEKLCALRHAGWMVDGIEPSRAASAEARKLGLNVQPRSLEEANLPAEYYDVIELSHVFEHLADPAASLAKLRDALATDGTIILNLPNADSLGFKVFGRAWRGLEVPRHYAVYSRDSLSRLCSRLGLRIGAVRGLIAPDVVIGSMKFAMREVRGSSRAAAQRSAVPAGVSCGSGYHPERRLKHLGGRAARAVIAAALLAPALLGMAEVMQVEVKKMKNEEYSIHTDFPGFLTS